MYAGRIVEDLPAADTRDGAQHPYTRALLAAVPDMDTDLDRPLAVIPGRRVDPAHVPAGCAYAARCPLADDHCRDRRPGARRPTRRAAGSRAGTRASRSTDRGRARCRCLDVDESCRRAGGGSP